MPKRHTSRVSLPYLQDWRASQGLTLEALAKKADVGRMTLYMLEAQRAQANPITLWKVARALGITRQQLIEERPPEGPTEDAAEETQEGTENGRAVA